MSLESRSSRTSAFILDLASRQHGVVSRKQLLELGMAPRMIEERVATRRLIVVFPGVYSTSAMTGLRGRWLAATMSCGQRVALSHQSAASLWGLHERRGLVEVVSASMRSSRIDARRNLGLVVHQTRNLPNEHLRVVDGIPVTSVSRTLVDTAGTGDRRGTEALFNEADRSRLLDIKDLYCVLDSSRGRRGVRLLREIAEARDPRNRSTRSELESQFLNLCLRNGLPLPEINTQLMSFEVDCFWRELKLVVELDGLAFHSHRSAIVNDLRRNAKLQSAGYTVLRLTYDDVVGSPDACLGTLRAHLHRAEQLRRSSTQLPA